MTSGELIGALIVAAIVVSIYAVMAVTFISSIKRAGGTFYEAHRVAAESGLNPYWQVGGARTTLMQASFPFAQLLVTTRQIDLFVVNQHHTIDRSKVTEISRTVWGAIRIRHTDISTPRTVIFLPLQARELMGELAARGYPVTPATLSGSS